MKLFSLMRGVLFLVFIVVFAGCGSSGNLGQSGTSSIASEESGTMTLEDHLRRINGVQIRGRGASAKVFIRGARGISSVSRGLPPDNDVDKVDIHMKDSDKRQPLFVVDGQKVGRDYPSVRDMFGRGEIKKVELLTDAGASQYGNEGGSGVIVITTKAAANNKK